MVDLAVTDPAAVKVYDLAGMIRDRENNAVCEKLPAIFGQNTQFLELCSFLVVIRHGFPDISSAITDFEAGKQRRIHETALLQVVLADLLLIEGGMVVIRDQRQQLAATKGKMSTGMS